MKISELINRQADWEFQRGIKNHNWGFSRILDELNEAGEEPDLYLKLVEYCDVLIVTGGSVGAVLAELNLTAEDFENLLMGKMATNDLKYPVSAFKNRDPAEAQALCREVWNQLQGK